MARILLALTLPLLALAGCTTPEAVPDEGTYTLTARDVPTTTTVGEPFDFVLEITGSLTTYSDHIGAHYWAESTDTPTADFDAAAGGCQHVAGGSDVPGTFTISCLFQDEGDVYLRGHLRITLEDGSKLNWWSGEHAILVRPAIV